LGDTTQNIMEAYMSNQQALTLLHEGHETGYTMALVDIRDILIACKDIPVDLLCQIDDRLNEIHEIRKASGFTVTN